MFLTSNNLTTHFPYSPICIHSGSHEQNGSLSLESAQRLLSGKTSLLTLHIQIRSKQKIMSDLDKSCDHTKEEGEKKHHNDVVLRAGKIWDAFVTFYILSKGG